MMLVNVFVDMGYIGVLVLVGFYGYLGFRLSFWFYDR